MRQIIINLVGNAVKFTHKGRISISVTPYPSSPISDSSDPFRVHFAITDTGVGIPSDRLERIFDPFTQVDSSTARRFGGTGLGTTISRQLAELMGGKVWAESEVGKGSTFHFTLSVL